MKDLLKQLSKILWLGLLLSVINLSGAIAWDNQQQSNDPSTRPETRNVEPVADQKPKFFPYDPVWVDRDQISIPKPKPIELSKIYDFAENTFSKPGDPTIRRAQNINTLGEVPDSSWFTNRIGLHPMTLEQLARGPNRSDGPDMSGPWTIISAKTQGVTPGFVMKDSRGDTYFIKLDPKKYPQMATSAEVISTKFFYAFGYNVPENYLAFFRPEQLKIGPEAKVPGRDGKKRPMTKADIDAILCKVPKRSDGTIQALASLKLPGEPLGPFKYYGTRSDDPNDIFPHENRRELRGLQVFFSWLNDNDSDATNTLDMYVTEAGRSYVKHYLIDFGTTLGSAAIAPHGPREGNAYYFEGKPTLKSALTLGLWDPPWRHIQYQEYPEIGRFEASYFRPEHWKPDYPNPAGIRMQNEDAFWATRTVMRFTDEMVRAIVKTGQISNPEAENFLVKTLLQRRDKILHYYLNQINPLDDFRLVIPETTPQTTPEQPEEATPFLNFKNLGVEARISTANSYEYQWFRFNNQDGSTEPLTEIQSSASPSIPVPQDASPYLMVRIRTLSPNQENWKKKVEVFIRNIPEKSVVGIEREN
ncbi:MAG TPA: hypothetical protein VNM22_20615 [Candidatus Limnocylindrales bacterium]|nr:hypothetical protein [Candidatus Limnocylindrales bacterium]